MNATLDDSEGRSAAPVRTLRIGTRRSPLALHQAELALAAWSAASDGAEAELVPMQTSGDRDPRQLRVIGDRGMFAHDLEAALVAGEIDAAVHSAKDLPVASPPEAPAGSGGLALAAWLPRADPRDALVGGPATIADLPLGARVATGSARRMAALRSLRADIVPSPVRGNVATRIERARERGDAACLLAMAGLERLALLNEPFGVHPLPVDVIVPEAAQGAVVIQTRAEDATAWAAVDHLPTRRTVSLERAIAAALAGGCERPIGVHVDLAAGRVLVFAAPSPDSLGRAMEMSLVGLELAPLLSVSAPTDIDDAALWVAAELLPPIVAQLGDLLGGGGA